MAKLVLDDIVAGYRSANQITNNNQKIEDAMENTLSRDGTGPNFMQSPLDMNGNLILNQGNPIKVEGFNWEGPWLTTTHYDVGDVIQVNNSSYICVVDHTSGVFNTDLSAGKWQLVASSASLPPQDGNARRTLATDGTTAFWASNDFTGTPISVAAYGAIGDGITDDSAAINAAILDGSYIYFPPGNYFVDSTINLPAKNLVLFGAGRSSRIFGSVTALITYPTSALDDFGNYVTQSIFDLAIETTSDNIGVQMHQTWDTSGKVGPTIKGCYFLNASTSTTTAKCISLQGVWEVDIVNNHFKGMGPGGGPTTGIGGYGIYISLGDNMNTSVMNVKIYECKFLTMAYPYFCSNRTLLSGGRVESVQIVGNWFVAGYKAIQSYLSLATMITNNLISDYNIGIELNGDFDFNISNNQQIDGDVSGIHLVAISTSLTERGVINGNAFKTNGSTIGIQLTNNVTAGSIRTISITGNTLGKVVVAETKLARGIRFDGAFPCVNITIANNTFQQQSVAIGYSASVSNTDIITSANSYTGCDTLIENPVNSGYTFTKVYSSSIVKTLTGGTLQEIISIAIPTGTFSAKPSSAHIASDGSHTVDPMVGFYSFLDGLTTSTNAQFMITRVDGANLGSGSRRFSVVMNGVGYATS